MDVGASISEQQHLLAFSLSITDSRILRYSSNDLQQSAFNTYKGLCKNAFCILKHVILEQLRRDKMSLEGLNAWHLAP